jgi:hypothetical protein
MNCIPARPVANLAELYIVNSKFSDTVIFKYVSFSFIFHDSIYEYKEPGVA